MVINHFVNFSADSFYSSIIAVVSIILLNKWLSLSKKHIFDHSSSDSNLFYQCFSRAIQPCFFDIMGWLVSMLVEFGCGITTR